jgi:peroxiredoxin
MTLSASGAGSTPQIGSVAPDFELPDSTGTLRRLSDLVAAGPLVLLFYRGHW